MSKSQLFVEIFSAIRGHAPLSADVANAIKNSPVASDLLLGAQAIGVGNAVDWGQLITLILTIVETVLPLVTK